MASKALTWWQGAGKVSLDQIADAHQAIGGNARGRRYATGQINNAYAVMLSSQFQKFCRDLHSEAADFLATRVDVAIQPILRTQLTEGRKLSSGNPSPANLGNDFNRFGLAFWPTVLAKHPQNKPRQTQLEHLNTWRNAIAHQDFSRSEFTGRTSVRLQEVQRWRAACAMLAVQFDAVLLVQLRKISGVSPW